MSIIDDMARDLDRRETELATMKLFINKTNITATQRQVLLRAAWAMLYAHYEWFAKFCLTAFYDEVSRRVAHCDLLPKKTKALALTKLIKRIKSMRTEDVVDEMEKFVNVTLKSGPVFPGVETEANLWPSTLEALIKDADLSSGIIDKHAQKMRVLVARRNGIAHGELSIINDVAYYMSFEEAVYEIMYTLVFMIGERLERHPYL